MYIDLSEHHLKRIIPVIETRCKLLKKKIIKEFGSDWADYDTEGLEFKVNEKSDEYYRLKQVLKQLTTKS